MYYNLPLRQWYVVNGGSDGGEMIVISGDGNIIA